MFAKAPYHLLYKKDAHASRVSCFTVGTLERTVRTSSIKQVDKTYQAQSTRFVLKVWPCRPQYASLEISCSFILKSSARHANLQKNRAQHLMHPIRLASFLTGHIFDRNDPDLVVQLIICHISLTGCFLETWKSNRSTPERMCENLSQQTLLKQLIKRLLCSAKYACR